MPAAKREFTRRSDRIEELVRRLENEGDPATRAAAQELLQAVIELHGIAVERIFETLEAMDQGPSVLEALVADDLVSGVLSLHGIHPLPLNDRVAEAIEKARVQLGANGGNVELVSIEGSRVHVRLQSARGSCASTAATLAGTVENAIFNAAPEISAVIAETMPVAQQLVTLRAN
jgi:Fe-S cluster biogenesis protein NfuA